MFELKLFDTTAAEEGVEVELTHPVSGQPIGARLRVRGTDAPSYREALLEQRRRRLEKLAKTGADRLTPEDLDAESLELLVAATLGWQGLALDGQPFEHSQANARTLYTRFPWIREQAAEAIGTRAHFLPRSANGS